MKIFKRILLSFALVAALMFAVACEEKPVKTNNSPVIHGAKDQTIEKGTRFVPLAGITATDEEDGTLTDSIVYTGNVNYNRVGEYTVTYTVYDSDGNKAEVTITVTVVLTDNEAPMLTGVADKQILVGEAFDPRAGVAATDAIDGEVDFTVEGEVNIWKVGEYVLTYKAEDEAGNKASSERTINVSLGNFEFHDNVIAPEVAYENGELKATVSSGPIDTSLAPFGLAELKFKASNAAAADLSFTLTNATSQNKVALTATETEYTVYFRLNQEITDGQLKLTGPASAVVTNVTLRFGVAVDSEAPVITVPEDYAVFLPGSITDPAVLKPFITKGVTAQDNVDGNVTSKLDVDFGDLVLGELDTLEEITIFAVDNAGNRAEAKVNVQFLTTYATDIIKDPGFDTGSAEADNWILNGGAGEKRLEFVDGVMIHEVKGQADAGWDSASSPALRYEQGVFRAGNWYMLKFDAKATVARNMTIRIGLDTTEALGWIENFKGAHNYPIDLTTEMKTYHVIFFVHSDTSEGGYGTVKVELKLGTFYWDKSKELNNPVTFDNFQFYLMSNVDNPPELTVDSSLPTKFGKGATVDFKPYVSAYDLEDAKHITITDAMIDLSGVNMNAAGVYTVVYTVADSQGNEATLELEIEVLATADTEAPVIAEVAGLVKTVDQFSDPIVLRDCVTVTDNVDTAEELIVTITGSVDVNKAGTYDVVYKARDLSGNQAEHTITFTVLDKEAPKFASDLVEDGILKVKQGKELDLTKVFRVNDNVDGSIALTMDNITGADVFMVGGKAEVLGEFEVTYKVQDAAGNEATVVITVIVEEAFELVEGNVLVDGLGQPGFTNGNSSALTVTEEADGSLKLEVVDIGGWTSFAHLKLDVTGASAINNYYLVRMKLKASKVREVQVKVGKSLGEDPWYNFFEIVEGRETFSITEEYMVYEMIYKANQENVTQAYLEFRFGSGLANAANGDIIYVEQFEVIELVKEQLVEGHVMLDVLWDQMFANGNSASSTIAYADGMATFTVSDIGGWASYAHAKVNIGSLDQGKNYKVIVEIKGSSERKVLINMGCQLNQDPWYEYYTSKGALEFTIGTEFAVHEIEFIVDKDTTANRYLEFRYGNLSGAANGDVITVKQFKIVEMVSSNEPPVTEAKVSFVAPENGEFTVVSVDYDGGSMTPSPVSDGGMVPIGHYIVVTPTPAEGYVLKSVKINGKVVPQTMGFYAFKVINGKDLSVSVDFALESSNPNIIDITGNTKDGYADYTFSSDFMTVTVPTAAGKWGRFDFDRITRPANRARATFSGGEGLKLQVKLDSNNPNNTYDSKLGNKQTKELLAGEVVFEWDLDALEIDSNILDKLVFWVYENGATSGEFKLVSLELYYVNPNEIEITGNSQGGSTFAFSEDFKTVTVNAVGNQWGRFNFARITRPANRARVTILGGEGLTLLLKLDSNNPNNTYDGKAGNKTSKGLTSGETVYEWDLEALGMDASILEKLVFWAYNNGSSTGEFTLVSLELYYEEPPAAQAKVNHSPTTNGSYVVDSYNGAGGDYTMHPVSDGGMVNVGHSIRIIATPADGFVVSEVKVNETILEFVYDSYVYVISDETELTVYVTFVEAPEPPATSYVAEIHTNNVGNAIYTWEANKKTVNCSAVPATMSQWANALFDAPTKAYNTIRITLTGTEGLSVGIKVDTQTPNNNMYDSKPGNKQYKKFGTDPIVIEWSLTALEMDALKIQKVVLWFYDASGTVTTASVTIDKIEFLDVEPPAAQAKVNHSPATNGTYVVDSFNGAGGDYTMHPVSDGGMVNVGHYIRITPTPADGFIVSEVKVNETIIEFLYDSYGYAILDETELTVYVTFEAETPEPNPNEIEITGNSQGGSTFAFSEDFKTVTVKAVGDQWGRFNFARITRPANRARVTILGGEGLTLLLKLDSNNPNNTYDGKAGNKTSKGLTSGETVYEWDLEALGMDASILEKLVFWAYNNGSSTGEFTLVSLELYYEEPPVAPYVAEIHTNNVGNAIYTWEANKKTVNCSAVPASMIQWANALFDAPTTAYNTVRITLAGTEGLSVGIKVDTQTPSNNMYDKVSGNKQYKKFGTDSIVIEWNLTALGMDALKIQKVVLWFYDESGTVTTASVTIESIEFLNV